MKTQGPYTIYGNLKIFTLENDQYIGPSIEHGHGWDTWMTEIITKFYKPGTDVLDIGGNIGANTLMFSNVVSDGGRVHVFEPIFHSVIQQNIDVNNLHDKITLHPVGLSKSAGDAKFTIPNKNTNGATNYGGCGLFSPGTDTINVPLENINNIYKGIPSFVKIDIEGMEPEVVNTMLEILYKYHPTLVIEIIPRSDVDVGYQKMIQTLNCIGYNQPSQLPEKNYLFTYGPS